jgi:hypothetical protein
MTTYLPTIAFVGIDQRFIAGIGCEQSNFVTLEHKLLFNRMMSLGGTKAELLDIKAEGSSVFRLVENRGRLLEIDDQLGDVTRGHFCKDLVAVY